MQSSIRSRRRMWRALLTAGIALALAACAQSTETSSGLLDNLAPAPAAIPTPSPTPTVEPTPTVAPAPTPIDTPIITTPDSIALITPREIPANDLTQYVTWIEGKLERPLPRMPSVTGATSDELADLLPTGRFLPGDTWELLVAVGLVDPQTDRVDSLNAARGDVLALCCPILISETGSAAFNEVVLVHELTHAFDDPQGRLASIDALEFLPMPIALVEGNAQRITVDYADEVLSSTYPDFELVEQGPAGTELPPAVAAIINFPYIEGQQFARDIVAHRGEVGIVNALEAPPSTSEHILDFQSYFADDVATWVDPPQPPAQSEEVATGTMGAFLVDQVLQRILDAETAREIAVQWDGDSYVLFRQGQQRCISVRFLMETTKGAQALADALAGQLETEPPGEPALRLLWTRCSDDVPERGARPAAGDGN